MEFKTEFFPLLDNLLYKTGLDPEFTIIEIRDVYLLARYVSFYHPQLATLVNCTVNQFLKNSVDGFDGLTIYKILYSILPKLPRKRIKYISKPRIKNSDEWQKFVSEYAEMYNISEREVWGMVYQLNNLKLNE